jgi:hypothetical protein
MKSGDTGATLKRHITWGQAYGTYGIISADEFVML